VNLSDYFEVRKRDNDAAYTCLVDEAPAWLYDAVQAAHGDELPNDWRYATCAAIVEALEDQGDGDGVADSLVDVYTYNLLTWLSDNLSRTGYVDEALAEDVWDKSNGVAGLIGAGQYLAICEMVDVLVEAIAENVDD
jgi:hypothetical protein